MYRNVGKVRSETIVTLVIQIHFWGLWDRFDSCLTRRDWIEWLDGMQLAGNMWC